MAIVVDIQCMATKRSNTSVEDNIDQPETKPAYDNPVALVTDESNQGASVNDLVPLSPSATVLSADYNQYDRLPPFRN